MSYSRDSGRIYLKRTASFKENLDLICEFIPQRPSSVVGRSHTLTLSRPSVERPGSKELLALGANRKLIPGSGKANFQATWMLLP